ncbi:MAG: RNA methyltransferase [Bacteroidota bacterium]|nr:RNA methyltransferase [Bacteroidota bacterium]
MDKISKSQIKLVNSLSMKKFRKKEGLFFCEGIKVFETLLVSDFNIHTVFGTNEFADKYFKELEELNFVQVTENELKKISSFSTPQEVLAVVEIPENDLLKVDFLNELTLVLDEIKDPGNLGTIVRIADWFGIKNIVCSTDSVDIYNSKTVQATMGSIFSVNVFYTNLLQIFKNLDKNIPVYGTFMDGENIYNKKLSKYGLIVLGNEANGISAEIEKNITEKISIPTFNKNKTAESLNISVATAIICSEFKRF